VAKIFGSDDLLGDSDSLEDTNCKYSRHIKIPDTGGRLKWLKLVVWKILIANEPLISAFNQINIEITGVNMIIQMVAILGVS
jgi:hypothetical protein